MSIHINKIGQIADIAKTHIVNNDKQQTTGLFGFGFNDKPSTGLIKKFNFEISQMGGFGQFNPTDADYNEMAYLDNIWESPEANLCEA